MAERHFKRQEAQELLPLIAPCLAQAREKKNLIKHSARRGIDTEENHVAGVLVGREQVGASEVDPEAGRFSPLRAKG
jgi:hypothetical protein